MARLLLAGLLCARHNQPVERSDVRVGKVGALNARLELST